MSLLSLSGYNLVIANSYVVEKEIQTTPTGPIDLTFDTDEIIDNSFVYGVEAIFVEQQSLSISGRPPISTANAVNCLLSLYSQQSKGGKGKYFIDKAPLTRFNPATYQGVTPALDFHRINLSKCKIDIVAPGTIDDTMSFLLNFFFIRYDELEYYSKDLLERVKGINL